MLKLFKYNPPLALLKGWLPQCFCWCVRYLHYIRFTNTPNFALTGNKVPDCFFNQPFVSEECGGIPNLHCQTTSTDHTNNKSCRAAGLLTSEFCHIPGKKAQGEKKKGKKKSLLFCEGLSGMNYLLTPRFLENWPCVA